MQKLLKALTGFFLIAALFTGIMAGALFYACSKLSDTVFIKDFLYKKYNLVFDSNEIKAEYSGLSVFVKSPYISIGEGNSAMPFLDVKDFSIRVKILPLLFRKISVSEFCAKEISINLKRLNDGSVDFLKYIKFNNSSFFSLDLTGANISVPKYDLNFNDDFVKNNFSVNGYSLVANGANINSGYTLATNGCFTVNGEPSYYLADIEYLKQKGGLKLKKHEILLYSLNLAFLEKYFTELGFSNFDTKLDIYSTAEGDFFNTLFYFDNVNIAFDYKGEKNTIISKTPLINEIVFNMENKDLVIKEGHFAGNEINIEYSGKIKNAFNPKEIEPELKISLLNSSLAKILNIAPDTLIPFQEPYVKNLKFHKVNGIINGKADVRYKNNDDFSVNGKIRFDDVYIDKHPVNAKTSFGECEFKGRDVDISVYVNAPNNAALTVFGKSRLQKLPDCEFDIQTYGKIDMAFAQTLLKPVQKILALRLGPLPYMDLNGLGEISLKTKGNKIKSNLYGKFTTDNASLSLEGLNALLYDGAVEVLFEGENITFNGAKGKTEGAIVHVDGSANLSGDMNLDVKIENIKAKDALKIARTSPLVTQALCGGEFLESFKPEKGNIDFNLNLSGNIPPDAVFGQPSDSILAKGNIIFKGVDLIIEPEIKGTNVKGELTFDENTKFNLEANIFNSPFKIEGKVEQKGANGKMLEGVPSDITINFVSDNVVSSSIGNFILDNISLFAPENRLFAINLAKIFNTNKFSVKGNIQAQGQVNSNSKDLDLSGFNFEGTINGINSKNSDFAFKEGNITLNGKNAKFNKLSINADGIDFLIDGNIDKFLSVKPHNNLKVVFYKSNINHYVNIFKKNLPEKTEKLFAQFKNFTGDVSGSIKLSGDKISGEFIPNNISFVDPNSYKIHLNSGKIRLKDEKTYFDSFAFDYDRMPVYFDGFIEANDSIEPDFNIYFSTNLNEENCDKLINPNIKYPVLITGETQLKGRFLGKPDSYTSYLTLSFDKGSDFSFMGLKLGDTDVKREIASKVNFKGQNADINYIRYFKYLPSKNKKQTPYDLIKISGDINLKNGEILCDNLHLLTPNPAPVRFLNPMFKKSLMKDGQFVSNLVLNGSFADIKAEGNLEFSNVLVPMYDSIIDDIKINLTKNTGKANFSLTFFDTKADITLDFVNKMSLPFIINDISIHSSEVPINSLMNAFALFADSASKIDSMAAPVEQNVFITPSDIQIKRGSIIADKILFNEVEGQNLKLKFSHSKDTSLKIDDAYLAIAGGLIRGNGMYKFDTKDIYVSSDFLNCDANELTKAFFNLQGQIHGNSNGKFTISMHDFTPKDYVNKIKADAKFEILNGTMPKLGSIEYLLRASNFFKSGIFGLTINNVIELLTPYKHGDFNKITGTFKIDEASLKDLKIYSQGDNLSTYTYGSYDIVNGIANIEILGKLSKNISNLLGAIGNASVVSVLNTLTRNKMDELVKTEAMQNVSKIPLMDLNNDDFRLFSVKLTGSISTDDVVKSFNWLN